jgi:phosphoribosyl 1,2-cyclic phosphodiesterase
MPADAVVEPMEITFYGVRGSIPSPPAPAEIQRQVAEALCRASAAGARFANAEEADAWLVRHVPFHQRASYGGDTTCILVRCGSTRIIVDAGSGIRRLGRDLMPELKREGRLDLHMLFTHMHLDHIVGFPHFSPLFVSKRKCGVHLHMHGGDAWEADLQRTLSATVSAPLFPVRLEKLKQEAATLEYDPICDGLELKLGPEEEITVGCRRLHHPNETYGFRIEYGGRTFVVATDTEPYAAPDPVLNELAKDADVIYVDAQYDWLQYSGQWDNGSRVGWGHGYAEWCGKYCAEAGVKLAVAGHHDPAATNQRVFDVGEKMRAEFPNTVIGFDGLKVIINPREILACAAGEGGTDFTVLR